MSTRNVILVAIGVSIILTSIWTYAIPRLIPWLTAPRAALSLGYYEEKNVWNRIRVDEKGRAICAPTQ